MITRHHLAFDRIDELRAIILGRVTEAPEYPTMNVGGWRSDERFFEWSYDCVRELLAAIASSVVVATAERRELRFVGWAVVNRRGSFHKRHNHKRRGNVMSGIFYLDSGGARTTFGGIVEKPDDLAVTPEPGLLVTFDAATFHGVEEHMLDTPRVTVAFDVR